MARKRGSRGGKNRNKASAQGAGAVGGGEMPMVVNQSGWDAARHSERRGRVVWRTMDTKRELSPSERIEVMRKVRAAEANIGIVKRCNEGVSNLIGNLKPQAATESAEWNKEVEAGMARRLWEPQAFDMAGKMDLFGWQDAIKLSKGRDGDALSVFMEGFEKGGRVLFYEAHQIGNGRNDRVKLPDNLIDGVFLDRWGGRAGFQLLNDKNERAGRVARERGIYHANMQRVGRVREVSALAHAVSNFLDMVEIIADTKHAIKVAALWGAVLETSLESDKGARVSDQLKEFWNLKGKDGADPGPEPTGEVMTMETITRGGRIQGLSPGQKMNTLQDTRPHPNQIALLSWLIRDIAWGRGVAPEIIWDATRLNGTATRWLMADTRKFVRKEQRSLERDCKRLWFYYLSKEIKVGRISEPPSGLRNWWASKWIPDADPTIDKGRDGALELQQLKKGFLTEDDYWASRGQDWEEQEYVKARIEKRKLEIRKEVLGE